MGPNGVVAPGDEQSRLPTPDETGACADKKSFFACESPAPAFSGVIFSGVVRIRFTDHEVAWAILVSCFWSALTQRLRQFRNQL